MSNDNRVRPAGQPNSCAGKNASIPPSGTKQNRHASTEQSQPAVAGSHDAQAGGSLSNGELIVDHNSLRDAAEPEPPLVEANEVLRTLKLLLPPGQVTEVRALDAKFPRDYRPGTITGFFNDTAALVQALSTIQVAKGIYITLNPVDPTLLARANNRLKRAEKNESAGDANILVRRWLLVDVDPVRLSGISSTDEEQEGALNFAIAVFRFLHGRGFPHPVIAHSGNGVHLLYRIDLPTDDGGLVKRCLVALAARFDDSAFKIDTSVHNPARIWRLYGTAACKGDHTADRPHRVSCILTAPDRLQIVDHELLEVLAADAPGESPSHFATNRKQKVDSFDIDGFIERHGLELDGPKPYQGGRCWTFRKSPMCEHHGDGPFLIQFAGGALSAGCHHDCCKGKWGWHQLRRKVEPDCRVAPRSAIDVTLPQVILPGGEHTISETAAQLGQLLATKRTHFYRGGVVTQVVADDLKAVRPAKLASDFERVAQLVTVKKPQHLGLTEPTTCTKNAAELILEAEEFTSALPPLQIISLCPVLVEEEGRLVEVVGYDAASGILARGATPVKVTLDGARKLLHEVLADFQFATQGDMSRALAAMITPALVLGGLLPGRAPIDLGEADQSQTGKGYRNKLTAAIYSCVPCAVHQRKRGVGGLEELFDRALIKGKTFIVLDNIRGIVDSQAIESFCTEDTYYARTAYSPVTEIDPRRVNIMLTSNQADMTVDLANRCSCVRLLKRPECYRYADFPEGDILAHIRANQPRYLGAVFAVVRAWHAAGKMRTSETRHDFRAWAQALDWMVQNLFDTAPLMDGHQDTQERMTNPARNWLREVALAVVRRNRTNEWLVAADLLTIVDNVGGIELPGLPEAATVEDDAIRRTVLIQIGRRLSQAFGASDCVTIDHLRIERGSYRDIHRRDRHHYRVALAGGDVGKAPDKPLIAPDGAKSAPDGAPSKPRVAPDAPDAS